MFFINATSNNTIVFITAPVCFSIKKPRDSDAVARDKSALPVEDSSEDEDRRNEESNITPNEDNQNTQEKTEELIENNNTSQIIEIEDPIMELIDLTDELEDKRDAKRGNIHVMAAAAITRTVKFHKNRLLL